MERLFLHSYQAEEIWSANYLHNQVTMEIKISALSDSLSYASGKNPDKFLLSTKSAQLVYFFASCLFTT